MIIKNTILKDNVNILMDVIGKKGFGFPNQKKYKISPYRNGYN